MTPDELIRMAQKAGLTDPNLGECVTDYGDATDGVLRFAKLVAAAEREACAKVCENDVRAWSHPGSITREECAAAIRARGEK